FSSSFDGAGKTRAHADANCRHCWRKQSWHRADDGYTSSAGISNAAIRVKGFSAAKLDGQSGNSAAIGTSAKQRWRGHRPAYFSPGGFRHRERAGWHACANQLTQAQTNRWRNYLGGWAVALFRRLVG